MAGVIGVFGGTFDPPHLGHLILADEARQALGLERVLWVLAGQPPHKADRPISPEAVRVEMVEAAIADAGYFSLSRIDLDRPAPHYSVDTLRLLRERNPRDDYAYLMGSDSLGDLASWHQPAEFVAACDLIGVMQRPGAEAEVGALEQRIPGISEKLHLFNAPLVGISGFEIRERVRQGRSYRYLVLPRVAEIVVRHGLYR